MSKRYAILGLSVVFALALAVPALGGPTNLIAKTSASIKGTANKALKKAKLAQKTANSALAAATTASTEAKTADTDANKAGTEAGKASTEAKKAQTTANTAQTAAGNAQATANTAKSIAEQAKAAAAAAEANANSRVKSSVQIVGEPGVSSETATKFASVNCPGDTPILGGGYVVGGAANKVTPTLSEQNLYGAGWFVSAQTIAGQTANWSLQAFAICGTR